jgi:hypothetical protein
VVVARGVQAFMLQPVLARKVLGHVDVRFGLVEVEDRAASGDMYGAMNFTQRATQAGQYVANGDRRRGGMFRVLERSKTLMSRKCTGLSTPAAVLSGM